MARALDSRDDRTEEPVAACEAAEALLPGLTYLAREAEDAGLDTVHELIMGALSGVLQWIGDESHDRCRPKDCH